VGGLTTAPLVWDKPWTVSFNLDFSVMNQDRPELFGWRMPANWSFNLLARAEAGQRYTPVTYNPASPDRPIVGADYSELGPYKSTLNIRMNKFWEFGRRQRLTMYLEFRNFLNHVNYRRVNPYTGDGYAVGDYNPGWVNREDGLTTDSEAYAKSVVDPSYIENPMVMLWGVSYSW